MYQTSREFQKEGFFGKINSLVCWSEWEDVIFEGALCSCETLLGNVDWISHFHCIFTQNL